MTVKKTHKSKLSSPFFPLFSFLTILLTFLGSLFLISSRSIFATPPAPSPSPTISTLAYVYNPNLSFTQSEILSSAFKTSHSFYAKSTTNNATGLTNYISSIDKNTSLDHENPVSTAKIPSISTPAYQADFASKTWGYYSDSNIDHKFNPIPKASAPQKLDSSSAPGEHESKVVFGVKTAPDLVSGTYSKTILFTAMTNYVPKVTTFLRGPEFNNKITLINNSYSGNGFMRSSAPPSASVSKIIVSTTDSTIPIYAWYDSGINKVLWWSDADIAYSNEDSSSMFVTESYNVNYEIDTRGINFSKTKNMSMMFSNGGKYNLNRIILDGFNTSSAEDMHNMFTGFTGTDLDVSSFNTQNVKNMSNMFSSMTKLANLNLSNFNTTNVTNMQGMFSGSMYLKDLDLSSFNTQNVTDMSNMFSNTGKLTTVNLSSFNTLNVTNMSEMFKDSSLTSLDLSRFITINVTSMEGMFSGVVDLKKLNLSNFLTPRVTDMSNMFEKMSNLEELNISNFNTSQVTTMKNMFGGAAKLPSLDLSHFRTSNVTDMSYMFSSMQSLSSLNISNFDTRNVQNMGSMFSDASNLTSLNLSHFNTSEVQDMRGMFADMHELITLDLSSFNTARVDGIWMFDIFARSEKLKTIYASTNFTTVQVPLGQNLFSNNNALVGGNGTAFATTPVTNKLYARLDLPGTPGYFTQK